MSQDTELTGSGLNMSGAGSVQLHTLPYPSIWLQNSLRRRFSSVSAQSHSLSGSSYIIAAINHTETTET
jgi:hypothetical protein